jgi:hypothetical protein
MAVSISNVDIATATFAGLVGTVNQTATVISNNAVTVDLSTSGASVSGNGSVNGTFSSTTLKAINLMGGNGTSSSNLTTLTIGFANSSTSSNVILTGTLANVTTQTLNITSNTNINATSLSVGAITTIVGNTALKSNNSTTLLSLNGNTTSSALSISVGNVSVVSDTLSVNSSVQITGNTILSVNSTSNFLSATSNTSETAVHVNAHTFHVLANTDFSGNVHTIDGDIEINTDQLFVDGASSRIGFFTDVPAYPVHVKLSNTSANTLRIDQNTYSTSFTITSSNTASGNGVVITAGNGNFLSLVTNASSSGINIKADGSVDFTNNINAVSAGFSGNTTITGNISVTGNTNVGNIYFSNVGSILSKSADLTFADTTPQEVDAFSIVDYQSAKYTIQAQNILTPNSVTMTELSMVTGFGNVHTVEYGTIHSNNAFVNFSSEANTTHAKLYVATLSVNVANSISVKLVRTNLS